MLEIPAPLREQFEAYLRNKPVPNSWRGAYKKWLRYYLDFCSKYGFSPMSMTTLTRDMLKRLLGDT